MRHFFLIYLCVEIENFVVKKMILLETIQILNGQPQKLSYHNDRMNRSRNALFCLLEEVFLEEYLQIPMQFQKGKVKCRVEYDEQVRKLEFELYKERKIDSFHLVETRMNYEYKYAERSEFNKLKASLAPSSSPLGMSEIILVKEGLITDTSYSNLIFKDQQGKWWTPEKPLLKGTHREFLLDEGIIEEAEIRVQDLERFSHFMMINALLDFDEKRAFEMNKIHMMRT